MRALKVMHVIKDSCCSELTRKKCVALGTSLLAIYGKPVHHFMQRFVINSFHLTCSSEKYNKMTCNTGYGFVVDLKVQNVALGTKLGNRSEKLLSDITCRVLAYF